MGVKRIDQLDDRAPLGTDYVPTTPTGGPSGKATWSQVLTTGALVWVDAVRGDDATGARATEARPFLTLTAAKTAAQAGDTIVVRPGTYSERNLLKNGVNWLGCPGADIVYAGSADGAIFDDSANGTAGAVGSVIQWPGLLRHAGTGVGSGNAAVRVANAGSAIVLRSGPVSAIGAAAVAAVLHEAGSLDWEGPSGITSVGGAAALWWSGGAGHYRVSLLSATGAGGYGLYSAGSGGQSGYLQANRIEGTGAGGSGIYNQSGDTTARAWVMAEEVRGAGYGIVNRGGKFYGTFQKVSAPIPFTLLKVVAGAKSETWLTIQKVGVEAGGSGASVSGNGSSLLCEVEVLHWEDLGAAVGLLFLSGGPNARVNVGSMRLAAGTTAGVTLASGVMEGRIDGTAASTGNPVLLADFDGVLRNTTLLAATGRNAVEDGGGGVVIEGTLTANAPVSATPLTGGPVVRLDTGGLTPCSLADAAAPNGTIYYSTDAAKLVYKDAGGVVRTLY